ncbi:hypothetical protein DPMN_042257 [Dreissena polymorpha]|uniref:Uncharacterized protein n=1 Tax=Dreissena polymorpha TaxID=45954 RepID=A0A9D4CYS8_DREPO|nr:hypothetical protein DPMN_042257 [Dreissena polymorpha]
MVPAGRIGCDNIAKLSSDLAVGHEKIPPCICNIRNIHVRYMSNALSVLLTLMTFGWSSTTLHGELCSGYVGGFVPSILDVGTPVTNLLFGKRTEPMMATNINSFKQTEQTQMRRRITRRLIWVYAVCQGLFSGR